MNKVELWTDAGKFSWEFWKINHKHLKKIVQIKNLKVVLVYIMGKVKGRGDEHACRINYLFQVSFQWKLFTWALKSWLWFLKRSWKYYLFWILGWTNGSTMLSRTQSVLWTSSHSYHWKDCTKKVCIDLICCGRIIIFHAYLLQLSFFCNLIPRDFTMKRSMCKKCHAVLKVGENATYRLRKNKHKKGSPVMVIKHVSWKLPEVKAII